MSAAVITLSAVSNQGSTSNVLPITLTISLENPSFAPKASDIDLPIVTINTNGTAIVDKTTDVPGTITITSPDGSTSYLPNAGDTDNTAVFHLHGNSTELMPKKPYHVKLNTSVDILHTMGLSCPYVSGKSATPICDKSKSYILLANYDDKTLLRNWAASALANAIPMGNGYLTSPAGSPTPSGTSALMPWAPHSLFVELFLNGVYEGNYQLSEEVKVDSHRVNIPELAETDITDDISGGYLLEIDDHADEAFVFETPKGLPVGLIDPDFTPDPEISQQTGYIANYVIGAEDALFSNAYTDPATGWRAYFDEAAAINYYIVNDLMGNLDAAAFNSSVYFYKAKDNPLLYMGPVWDFDLSSGNVINDSSVSAAVPIMQSRDPWYTQWFSDPGFYADVVSQWNALKTNGVLAAWLASINLEAVALNQSQINNFGRWPMQGIRVWPNAEAAGSYQGEVSYFTDWISLRTAFLDSEFNPRPKSSITLTSSLNSVSLGSAVTLSAQVSAAPAATGTVYFLSNGVLVGAAAMNAQNSASISATNLLSGSANIVAVYSGDGQNALSTSNAATVQVN